MSSVISKDAPSQFAALLRRSKFASYDQRIGQVYTAYGGYAHRGDWGLKRPMPQKIRTRRPYISITAVDSLFEQTEWERRGPAARFVDSWNEMGMDQVTMESGGFGERQNFSSIDSDFARPPGSDPLEVRLSAGQQKSKNIPVLNVHKMKPQEFEKYLDKLRTLRPKFKQFVVDSQNAWMDQSPTAGIVAEDRLKKRPAGQSRPNAPKTVDDVLMDVESGAPEGRSLPDQFIATEVSLSGGGGNTNWIEQRPHSLGALSYTVTSGLQSQILFPPVKGRLMEPRTKTSYVATVAGVTASFNDAGLQSTQVMDFGPYSKLESDPTKWTYRRPDLGVYPMRITGAALKRVPRVVDRIPEDLRTGTELSRVVATPYLPHKVANPYFAGSPQWVAASRPSTKRVVPLNLFKTPSMPTNREVNENRQTTLLKLRQFMPNPKSDKGNNQEDDDDDDQPY